MLVNGDHFRGNLTGTTEQHYLLDTCVPARSTRRKSVRKIAPLPRGLKTVFRGRK